MVINQLSLLYLISAIITATLAVYAWNRRENQAVMALLLLLAALSVWSFGYGLELALTDLTHMKLANMLQYIGIATIPPLYFYFAALYTGNDHHLTPVKIALLFVIPVITLTMLATNNFHFLYYSSVEFDLTNGYSYLKLQSGPFWWLHVFYSYIILLIGLLLFIRMFFKVSHENRAHLLYFILGSMFPFVANFLDITDLLPYGYVELTSLAFMLTGFILALGVFTSRLIEVTPIALELLFENNPDPVIVLDIEGKIISANPAAKSLSKLEKPVHQSNANRMPAYSFCQNLLKNGADEKDIVIEDRIYASKKSLITSQGGRALGTMIVMRDITKSKQYEAELINLSFHDQLTGLYNRHYFMNELKRLESSREHPVAVVSADLDNLKLVNDAFGHSEGDHHLKIAAKLLKESLRSSDALARVGGDEFALLLPRTDQATGEEIIGRIYHRIEKYNRELSSLPLSLSMGLAVKENAGGSLEETYHTADNLMYKAKYARSGKASSEMVDTMLSIQQERYNLYGIDNRELQDVCSKLGRVAGLGKEKLANLKMLARVCDIGMVTVPESIFKKETELTATEMELIKQHAERGYLIALATVELSNIETLILHHHENWDGSGYPSALKGPKIPLECRALAVAFNYLALTKGQAQAGLEALKAASGKELDPKLVEVFLKDITP